MKDLLQENIDSIIQETGTIFNIPDDEILHFIMVNGSDSVVLVWDIGADLYSIEVFPINNNLPVKVFTFRNKREAIEAFNMWKCYYTSVVVENFKMF